jgi:hypothetical protein
VQPPLAPPPEADAIRSSIPVSWDDDAIVQVGRPSAR